MYMRGLQASARCADQVAVDSLKTTAELWQNAGDLYRKIGDKSRALELERSLASLYRKRFSTARGQEAPQAANANGFDDWAMFFKIGCFGFGGPMAVFGLLEDELVRNKKILSDKDFLEGAVLGDVLPGPVTMDIVTYTGYKLQKWRGALISTTVFILPSFLIMLVFAMLYEAYSITPQVKAVLGCLGAAVTGLILSVGLNLSKSEIKDYRETAILVGAFGCSLIFKLDIVITVGLAGLVGIVLYSNEPEDTRARLDDYVS